MNFKDLVKKYWFVGIVGIVLIGFVIAYSINAYNNREITVSSKQEDGKYVAYSVNGENAYADDLYETLYDASGISVEYTLYQRAVLNASYETTEDIESTAESYSNYVQYQYDEDEIVSDLYSMGYTGGIDDLKQYYIDAQKQELLIDDYFKDNMDTVVTPYIEENNPRIIYHILVKVATVEETTDADGNVTHTAHPTQEEQDKLNSVLEALKTQDFEEVATEYSDDSTAEDGGYLGVVDLTNYETYVQEFRDTCMALESGEVSDVITTEYGYHIIWNKSCDAQTLLENSDFISLLETADSAISIKAITAKAEELGFKIVDEELANQINLAIGGEE